MPETFKAGDRTIPASFLNDVAALLRRNITTSGDLVVQHRGSGLHFSLSPLALSRVPEQRTVLVVRKPGGSRMMVRQVRYRDAPPQECEGTGDNEECFYEFGGDEFPAYPDFGLKVEDYETHEGSIRRDSQFLKCYRENMTWRVEKPVASGTANAKVVRATAIVADSNPQEVTVQVQKPTVTEQAGYTGWEPDGEPMDVFVWPGLDDSDYRPLIETNSRPFAKIEQYGGLWFLRQIFPTRFRFRDNRPSGRCSPV